MGGLVVLNVRNFLFSVTSRKTGTFLTYMEGAAYFYSFSNDSVDLSGKLIELGKLLPRHSIWSKKSAKHNE